MSDEAVSSGIVKVVAAVFRQGEKYLACRRKPQLANGGEWEFPGGKQNPDELPAAALAREIEEELNVIADIGSSLGTSIYHYEKHSIELHCFFVSHWVGELTPGDHDKLEWFTADELATLNMSAADLPFIKRIRDSLS